MAGPFPGVDPYIENPAYWRGFHNGLITFITAALNAILPTGFAANYEERVYIIPPERSIYPDVLVLQRPADALPASNTTAGAEAGAPHGILTAYPEEMREGFVEVRSADDWDHIITVIEVLSPANKVAGSVGRDEYQQKQSALLRSDTHLLEIDLLRRGMHTVAAPLERLRQYAPWDGLICLHRATARYHYEYRLSQLREPLPTVRVPLTPEIPDVLLDLQMIYDRVYDAGPYRRRVDYSSAPPVTLDEAEAEWASTLLREKGLRS
jgi:hypothetical protein